MRQRDGDTTPPGGENAVLRAKSANAMGGAWSRAAALGLVLAAPAAGWPAEPIAPAALPSLDGRSEIRPQVETPVPVSPMDEARTLLQLLQHRKQELDRREEAIRADEQRLAALKSELEAMLNSFEQKTKAAEAARQAEAERRKRAEADERKATLLRMVQIYEAMPVEDAAARIDKLPDRSAIELLRAMKGKTAGAILAQMKPAKAALLSQRLIASR